MHLDSKDWDILRALQRDGRASAADIAERIHLSPSSVSRRIQRLEQERVITGYSAEVNQQRIGYELTVMVEISLDSQSDEAFTAFESAVAKIAAVHSCYLMSGEMDYLLRVVARNIEDFERIHRRVLSSLPHVDRMHSAFTLREVVARAEFVGAT
jgi:Lrp/AsnC family leucine-responsive transcriptional regulator